MRMQFYKSKPKDMVWSLRVMMTSVCECASVLLSWGTDHHAAGDPNLPQSVWNLEQTQKDPRALQVHHDDARHSLVSSTMSFQSVGGGKKLLESVQRGRRVYILPILILSDILFPLPPLFWCKLVAHWWRWKDKLIDQAGGYWSIWTSAMTHDLSIDSSLYNEASEKRPWVGAVWGWASVGGKKKPKGIDCVETHMRAHKHSPINLAPLLHRSALANPNLHNRLLHCLAQTH